MTVSQLYALYRAAHVEAWRASDGGVLRAHEIQVNGAGFGALERLILELALHDATNGSPMRSLEGFERALEQGADILERLGLRLGPGAATGRSGSLDPLALDQAA